MTNSAAVPVTAVHSQRFLPGLLPARLVHVLDRGRAHRLGDLLVGRRQGFAQLPLQGGDAAQRERDAEDDLGDLLQPAVTDVVAALQVAQHGRQTRAEGVGADLGGDGLAGDVAAAGAGPGVALELGDHGLGLGQLGELVPDRLGVARGRSLGQRRVAVLAVGGDQGDRVLDTFGRQAEALVAVVAGLATGLAAGVFLDDRGRGLRRVGGGRDRGVGGVGPHPLLQVLDLVAPTHRRAFAAPR